MTFRLRKSSLNGLKHVLAGIAIIGVTSVSAVAQDTYTTGEQIIITPPPGAPPQVVAIRQLLGPGPLDPRGPE